MNNSENLYFDLLCSYGTLETVPKGHVFYACDEEDNTICCLKEGLCSLMSLKSCGKEHIYYYLKAPTLLGFTGAVLSHYEQLPPPTNPYFMVVAKTDCIIYKLKKNVFFDLLQKQSDLLEYILFSLADTSRNILRHFYVTQETCASSKVACTLLSLSEESNGVCWLHKAFNYHELGKYLGIHHITVARIISCFKEEGILQKVGRKIIILNKDALQLYAENIKILQY